tara:strand:- start:199 stop:408 length:210 start_codon:yes stop_codon:yes gene_type:complete
MNSHMVVMALSKDQSKEKKFLLRIGMTLFTSGITLEESIQNYGNMFRDVVNGLKLQETQQHMKFFQLVK